jgi:hypothetical protein
MMHLAGGRLVSTLLGGYWLAWSDLIKNWELTGLNLGLKSMIAPGAETDANCLSSVKKSEGCTLAAFQEDYSSNWDLNLSFVWLANDLKSGLHVHDCYLIEHGAALGLK